MPDTIVGVNPSQIDDHPRFPVGIIVNHPNIEGNTLKYCVCASDEITPGSAVIVQAFFLKKEFLLLQSDTGTHTALLLLQSDDGSKTAGLLLQSSKIARIVY